MTSFTKHWLRSAAILAVLAAPAAAQTQMEMNRQACDDLALADAAMTAVYKTALSYYSDPVFEEKFRQAQRTWIVYRDAQLAAYFALDEGENAAFVYGSMYPTLKCGYQSSLTQDRTKFLKEWLAELQDEQGMIRTGGERYR